MGRYRNITILGAVVILQILGLAIQIKRQEEDKSDSTRLIRIWTVGAVSPFEKLFVRVQSGTGNIWHNYFYLRGVRQQNRDLQQQIQQMQIEETRLRQDAEQAHRLQALLSFKEQFVDKTVAAQVIGTSGSEQSRLVSIDKGSDDGVKADMAVITPNGIVGKVLRVINGSTSQVLLINDQNSGVGIILEQSRLQGVLKGKASGELLLDQIMSEEDVKPGDRVLTSGGDQIFPKGLPIGTVSRVIHGTEFLQVLVQPSATLNHLEEVLVITKQQDREPAGFAGNPVRAADILAERLPSVPDAPAGSSIASNPGAAVPGGVKPIVAAKPPALTPGTVPAIAHKSVAAQPAGIPAQSSPEGTAKSVAVIPSRPAGAADTTGSAASPKPVPAKPASGTVNSAPDSSTDGAPPQ